LSFERPFVGVASGRTANEKSAAWQAALGRDWAPTRTVWRLIDDGSIPVAHIRGSAWISDQAIRDFADRVSRWHNWQVRRQLGYPALIDFGGPAR